VSCGGSSDPVGEVTVTPERAELGYPGFADLDFAFQFEQPLEGLSGDLRVFVHLLDAKGGIVRTFDHDLPVPWRPGSSHEYTVPVYQSVLAPPLAPGEYDLTVGLHDAAGRRWALRTATERGGSSESVVATLTAVESVDAAPMFLFPDVWRPSEGGTDRQVLARRWLGGTGSLRLAGLRSPGAVWMAVGVPVADQRTEELILDEGATTPTVEITPTCSDYSTRLEGIGSHPVTIPVTAAAGELSTECEVAFDANFYLVSLDTLARRTVALENLSWSPR
jgi:hypothetical protein